MRESAKLPTIRHRRADDAAVHVIPEQLGVWQPSDNSQADRSTAAFSYGGFSDINNVEYYQYMLQYGATQTEWISIGKQVRIWVYVLSIRTSFEG